MHEKHLKAIGHSLHVTTPGSLGYSMKAKNAATPLCYVEGENGKPLGHQWQETTSPKVRRCSRCHLVQRKNKNGRWENARSLKDVRASNKQAVEIATLWETLEGE